MHQALNQLGQGPVYHMLSILRNPPDSTMWQEAIDAKYFHKGKPFTRSDWDQLLGQCASVTDLPPAFFAEELITAYPDAKVILTNRDVDAWYHSVMTTVIAAPRHPFISALSYFDNDSLGMWRPMIRKMFEGAFGGLAGFEANGKEIYREHYDKVRAMVPKERLLDFQVGEGWERLCEFLEVPVPEGPFPRVNEAKAFGDRIALIGQRALKNVMLTKVLPVLGTVTAVAAAGYYWMDEGYAFLSSFLD